MMNCMLAHVLPLTWAVDMVQAFRVLALYPEQFCIIVEACHIWAPQDWQDMK